MKYCLFYLLLLVSVTCKAQTPQYESNGSHYANYFPLGSADGKGRIVRLLYKPSDFSPALPSGYINVIYFKAFADHDDEGLSTYDHIEIKMGSGKGDIAGADSLTTVFEANNYEIRFHKGEWLNPFVLSKPWFYNDTSNILIEMSTEGVSALRYIATSKTNSVSRMWKAAREDNWEISDSIIYKIGFDITPANTFATTLASSLPASYDEENTKSPITRTPGEAANTSSHKQQSSDILFLLGMLGISVLSFSSLFAILPKTKKVAHWALHNTSKARWLSITLQSLSGVGAAYMGILLQDNGITATHASTNSLYAASILGALLYPRYISNHPNRSYVRQKLAALYLLLTGIGLMCNITNRCAADKNYLPYAYPAVQYVQEHYSTPIRQAYNTEQGMEGSTTTKVILTVFVVALALIMIACSVIIGCAIYCVLALEATSTTATVIGIIFGGATGLAGIFGSTSLFLWLWRRIWAIRT